MVLTILNKTRIITVMRKAYILRQITQGGNLKWLH
jgi:hypothetical protein